MIRREKRNEKLELNGLVQHSNCLFIDYFGSAQINWQSYIFNF